jgi:hypothetical protein
MVSLGLRSRLTPEEDERVRSEWGSSRWGGGSTGTFSSGRVDGCASRWVTTVGIAEQPDKNEGKDKKERMLRQE